MIKYLRWNTANKRIKDLINNTNFNEVRISDKAGDYTFLIDMPSGEHIELWLGRSYIGTVWYCNGEEKASINANRYPIARKFVYELYKAVESRKDKNDIEKTFSEVVDGAFHPFYGASY